MAIINIIIMFAETDSDVEDVDKNIAEYITDDEEFSPGSPSNGLSSTQPVTLGQSNGRPGDALQFPAECPQVQDEHPWLKTVCEEDDEKGEGGKDAETMYETDEEEFTSAVNTSILPGGEQTGHYPSSPCTRTRAGEMQKSSKAESVGHIKIQLQPRLLQSLVE